MLQYFQLCIFLCQCRGLVRVHAERVWDEGNRHPKKGIHPIFTIKKRHVRSLALFTIGIFTFKSYQYVLLNAFLKQSTVSSTSTLTSGRVRRTPCQISESADAPVAPILTRPLPCLIENLSEKEGKLLPRLLGILLHIRGCRW